MKLTITYVENDDLAVHNASWIICRQL